MGTTQSHSASEREWKGPFSDEEYECLATKFKDIAAGGSKAAAQKQLQTILALPVSEELPSEWRGGLGSLGASFYELCLHARETNASPESDPKLKLADFAQGVAMAVRGSSQGIARALFRMFLQDKTSSFMDELSVHRLFVACLLMADQRTVKSEPAQVVRVAKALADAALPMTQNDEPRQLSLDDFLRWTSAQAPLLYTVFTSWLSTRLFGSIARPAYTSPRLSHKSEILSQSQSIALSLTCTPLQNGVDRLYTNAQDGLSFNRLCHHILGYGGPTLVLIRTTDAGTFYIFGMYCDTEWRETTKFYGSNSCFLFRVDPFFNIYRTSANENSNYMYLNTKGVALPRGLGIGGDVNGFRLFLNEDFDDNCYTAPKCLSFEPGRLASKDHFSVESLEVWGCGGDSSASRQREYRKDTADMINKMRKVDKAAFVGNDFDRSMFLGKTFGHGTDQSRVVDDEK